MNLLKLLDGLNLSNLNGFYFYDNKLHLHFNWAISLAQFKEIASNILACKPNDVAIDYSQYKIIIAN